MTYGCNRNCEGCYTNLQADRNLKMSIKTADDVAKWLVNLAKVEEAELFSFPILGGEPLMNADVLFHLIATLQRDLPKHLKNVRARTGASGVNVKNEDRLFILFTNGDYLTEENLRRIEAHRLLAYINPTDDNLISVEEKVKKLKAVCGHCNLAITLNKKNMPRLPELVDIAIRNGGVTRISRMYDGGRDPNYVKEYGRQMHKVFDMLLAAPVPMHPNWIVESTWVTWDKPSNPNGCGKWSIHMGPDGVIRSCNADYSTKIGSIYTHSRLSDFKFTHRWSAKNLPECQGCEFITFCQGGCPYSRKLTYGTYDKRTPFCEELKTLYPRVLELAKKWKEYQERIMKGE
jgi:radical SAM protein with 4Fe4S-binding SPASM domain